MFLFSPLFWLFVGVPLTEIALFAWVGGRIGVLATVVIVLVTAAAGAMLVRRQGLSVLQRAQENMARGVMPHRELVDGVLILAAGLLLLTPGFLTDTIGFLLLVPAVRAMVRSKVAARLKVRVMGGFPGGPPPGDPFDQRGSGHRASDMEIVDRSPANERDPEDR